MNQTAHNALAVVEQPEVHLPQSPQQLQAHIKVIQQVMGKVMNKDVHYGVIPGTSDNTLFKPGAEILLTTFHIAVIPEIQDISSRDEIRYRVLCKGVHQGTGVVMGVGIGECSSSEEKYKWRKTTTKEYDATPDDRRRLKYGKYENDDPWKQVRTEPADLANTVLKMAKKRAETDLCLTALACSDAFERPDSTVEKPPAKGNRSNNQRRSSPPPSPPPEQHQAAPAEDQLPAEPGAIVPNQVRLIRSRLGDQNEADLCLAMEIASLELLPVAKINEALEWCKE